MDFDAVRELETKSSAPDACEQLQQLMKSESTKTDMAAKLWAMSERFTATVSRTQSNEGRV